MILIISSKQDQSTCDVIDWLIYYNKKFFIVTEDSNFIIHEMDSTGEFIIEINNIIIKSSEIKSVWYRRGVLKLPSIEINPFEEDDRLSYFFMHFHQAENNILTNFLHSHLHEKKSINNQNFKSINKLYALKIAQKCGLQIPTSIITTQKKVLESFVNKYKNVITKPINDSIFFHTEEHVVNAYTELITKDFINKINTEFSASFFQELIHKKFEIRSFYFNNKFYSMAIFSQKNPKTKIDFRHYDKETPNRFIPFKIPIDIENQLSKLMKYLNLNSGSIDLIYGNNKKYYFLEVNPVGQFGMTSYPCNYYIEKEIAKYL
jgi:ATP-GRASP peptide maturase of grasp-with-spasm system